MLETNIGKNKIWTQSCFFTLHVMRMLSYLSFSRTCESLPRPYLFSYPQMKIIISGLGRWNPTIHRLLMCSGRRQQGALCVDSLMTFPAIDGFRGARQFVPSPEPCLTIPSWSFRLKLAINAVLLSVHQPTCHAQNIAGLEWSQT